MCLLTNGRRIHSREVRSASENGLSGAGRRGIDMLLYGLFRRLSWQAKDISPVYRNFLHQLQSPRDGAQPVVGPILLFKNGPQRAYLPKQGSV